jgi:hypothetical protein
LLVNSVSPSLIAADQFDRAMLAEAPHEKLSGTAMSCSLHCLSRSGTMMHIISRLPSRA